jgi:hypothetical protein
MAPVIAEACIDCVNATASYSDREMHAALEVNIPNYANAIMTTKEIVGARSSLWVRRIDRGKFQKPRTRSSQDVPVRNRS